MIEFVHKKNNKNLILFIHGLTGSNETWLNEKTDKSFPKLLSKDKEVKENFDIAYFEYFTSFLDLKTKVGGLLSFFSKDKSNPKNISIKEISQLLNTRIDYELINYDDLMQKTWG